jgi:hypothetical protein
MRQILLLILILKTFSLHSQGIYNSLVENKRFNGAITIIDKNTIQFGVKTLFIFCKNDTLKDLFKNGTLYPEIFGEASNRNTEQRNVEFNDSSVITIKLDSTFSHYMLSIDSLTISEFEQTDYYDQRPNVRIFSFLLLKKRIANPIRYKVELTNYYSNKKTDLRTFIKGAYITRLIEVEILI